MVEEEDTRTVKDSYGAESVKWIKCSDRLPDDEVLLWNGKFVDLGSLSNFGGKLEWITDSDSWYDLDYFTHWMPLPEGPKDEVD